MAISSVVTLTLGTRPKQGVARLRAKRKLRSERKCEGMNPTLPRELPPWEFGVLVDS